MITWNRNLLFDWEYLHEYSFGVWMLGKLYSVEECKEERECLFEFELRQISDRLYIVDGSLSFFIKMIFFEGSFALKDLFATSKGIIMAVALKAWQ